MAMPKLPHSFPFDPTYGHDETALRAVEAPPEPEGFAAFWRESLLEARKIQPNITRRDTNLGNVKTIVEEIEFDSWEGVRIGGWLVRPRDQEPQQAMIVAHGYGGRAAPDLRQPGPPAIALYPCARGFHRSASVTFPDTSADHVLHGIESRSTYIHRGCCADFVWCAANVMLTLAPHLASKLHYLGGSFGGGIGALGLPWDDRFVKAALVVPSFGNYPLRVTLPCEGSGKAVGAHYGEHPEALEALRYFDAAVAARHFRIPVIMCCARFDPAVPPPGQFAVFNAAPEPKELMIKECGHFASPQTVIDELRWARRLEQWFA